MRRDPVILALWSKIIATSTWLLQARENRRETRLRQEPFPSIALALNPCNLCNLWIICSFVFTPNGKPKLEHPAIRPNLLSCGFCAGICGVGDIRTEICVNVH